MNSLIFRDGQKILFIGDSITDAGRLVPEAMPFGNGYVAMVRNILTALYPQVHLEFINRGVGGDTVMDLAGRWRRDVIDERPDWLSVCIGINDVWSSITTMPHYGVDPDTYESTYRSLLSQTVDILSPAGIILLDPYVIEANPEDPFRKAMQPFLRIVSDLAVEFSAVHVKTQDAFDRALHGRPSMFWADDRVHPEGPGHAVIALEFLRAAGIAI